MNSVGGWIDIDIDRYRYKYISIEHTFGGSFQFSDSTDVTLGSHLLNSFEAMGIS